MRTQAITFWDRNTHGYADLKHVPMPDLLPVRVPKIVSLLIASFGPRPSRPGPCFSLRLLSLLPIISFHMTSLSPCRAHWFRLCRTPIISASRIFLKLAKIWIGANLAKVGESGEGSFPDEKADFLRSRRLFDFSLKIVDTGFAWICLQSLKP